MRGRVPIMHVFLGEEHSAERETFLALAEKFAGQLVAISMPKVHAVLQPAQVHRLCSVLS